MIIRNSAKCLKCGEEIESEFRHDFKTCSCGNLGVDGGKSYIKRIVEDFTQYEDTSRYEVGDAVEVGE